MRPIALIHGVHSSIMKQSLCKGCFELPGRCDESSWNSLSRAKRATRFVVAAAAIGLGLHPIERSFPKLRGQPPELRRSTGPSNAARYWPDSARTCCHRTQRGAMGGANAAKSSCHRVIRWCRTCLCASVPSRDSSDDQARSLRMQRPVVVLRAPGTTRYGTEFQQMSAKPMKRNASLSRLVPS